MACPKCGCKVHYQYDSGWDGVQPFENLERCAACGEVFDIEDSTEEEDDDLQAQTLLSEPCRAGRNVL